MSAYELDKNNAGSKAYRDNKAESVPADVEHDTSVPDPIRTAGIKLDIGKTSPLCTPTFRSPLPKGGLGSGMQHPEVMKMLDLYYAHAPTILQYSAWCVNRKLRKMVSAIR